MCKIVFSSSKLHVENVCERAGKQRIFTGDRMTEGCNSVILIVKLLMDIEMSCSSVTDVYMLVHICKCNIHREKK